LTGEDLVTKRTHKRRALGDVATVIRAAPSVAAAARTLGVSRQAIYDWIRAGVAPRPGGGPAIPPQALATGPEDAPLPESPDEWAVDIRERYALTGTENLLVSVGHGLLTIALNTTEKPADRATAAGRWMGVVRALNLEKSAHGEAETPADVRPFPRRVG
jgi:transposase-like protein